MSPAPGYYMVTPDGVTLLLLTEQDTSTAERANLIGTSSFGAGYQVVCTDLGDPYNKGCAPEDLRGVYARAWDAYCAAN